MPKRTMSAMQVTQDYSDPPSSRRKTVKRKRFFPKGKNSVFDRRVREVILRSAEPKRHSSQGDEQLKTTIDVDPYIIDIPFNLGLGDNTFNRTGNRVHARGIRAQVLLHNRSGTSAATCFVRMAILEVKAGAAQTNAGFITDLYDPLASGGDVTYSGGLPSLLRSFNKEQLKVLRDEVVTLSPTDAGNGQSGVVIYKKYVPLDEKLFYSDGDLSQPWNKRYVVLILPLQANSDESTGTQVEVSYVLDSYFKDI